MQSITTKMDAYTANHLNEWLGRNIPAEDKDSVLDSILNFLLDHPDVIGLRSWSEIRMMAEGSL